MQLDNWYKYNIGRLSSQISLSDLFARTREKSTTRSFVPRTPRNQPSVSDIDDFKEPALLADGRISTDWRSIGTNTVGLISRIRNLLYTDKYQTRGRIR